MKLRNPLRKQEDPEVKAAYEKARREARIERAKEEGRKAGLTKKKPFYERIGGLGEAISKDLGKGRGGGRALDLDEFVWGKPSRKRKSKKRRKK